MSELLEIYDTDLKKIGIKPRNEVHSKGYLHAVSHLWITDIKKEIIYLQKRSLDKDSFPGYYDITSAGHIDPNETPETAILREVSEEIGLNLNKKDLIFLGCIIEHFENDHEIAYIYICDLENPIFKLGEEVTEIIPVPISSLMSKQDKLCFTDEHLQPRIISREMICPHDLSLVDEYLKNKLA